MKLSLLFIISLLFCSRSISQVQYFVEYNFSTGGPDHLGDLLLNNSISFGRREKQMFYSFGLGREDWFLNYFDDNYKSNTNLFTIHCYTFKLTPMIERQFLIPKSNFSFRIGTGCKIFILNQLKDSISLKKNPNFFTPTKPSVISKFNPYAFNNKVDGITFGSKDEYYYITNVPYVLTANFAIQYAFKKWAIKLQYEPTLIRVKTRNAVNSNVKSSVFFFYNNIGIGVNYPLNFKQKDKQNSGLQ